MSVHIYLLPKLVLFPQCQLIVHSGTCQDAGWNPSSTTFQLGHTEKPLYSLCLFSSRGKWGSNAYTRVVERIELVLDQNRAWNIVSAMKVLATICLY